MTFTINNIKYFLLYNYKEAFDLELFKEKYIEELFKDSRYILGDLSDKLLRLKGFNNKDEDSFLDKYLNNSCSFDAPFFLLKRVDKEDNSLKTITPISIYNYKLEKVNFNFDDLILTSNPYVFKKLNFNFSNYDRIHHNDVREDVLKIINDDKKSRTTTKRRGNNARYK